MFGNAAVIRLLSQRTRKDPMKNKKLLGNVLLLITALIWGTAFSFQRVGMESVEPITFCASRMALAAIAVVLGLIVAFNPFASIKATVICAGAALLYTAVTGILTELKLGK